jgi:acetyl-CoA C-acetyltransferase
MIDTAENLASDYGIDREAADAFAARSHQRAAAAARSGGFDAEIAAVEVPQRRGDPVVVDHDDGVRSDTTTTSLAKLRTVMSGGTVTAGNSSQQNDAGAACLVVAEDRLDGIGLVPIGYLEGWAAVGCEPSRMGIGPAGAVEKLFSRTGFGFDDLSLIEINEAFAVQVIGGAQGIAALFRGVTP